MRIVDNYLPALLSHLLDLLLNRIKKFIGMRLEIVCVTNIGKSPRLEYRIACTSSSVIWVLCAKKMVRFINVDSEQEKKPADRGCFVPDNEQQIWQF